MIAKIVILSNHEEIEKASEFGMTPPDKVFEHKPLWFNISDVKRAFVSSDNDIILDFEDGESYAVVHTKEILDKLNEKFL